MPGQDFLAGGLTVEDGHWLGEKLRGAGACLLDVSSGIGGWRRPGTRIGEGYLLEESAGIQSRVELPVIGVGGIESGSFIDRALREKKLSLAAVGRAILGDPEGWARKWLDPAPSNFMR